MIEGHLCLGLGTSSEQRISLEEIVAVGEHTNEDGPHFEDYWLTIVLRNGNSVEVGSEDPDSSSLYAQLGISLSGARFLPGLCNQTSFASRILWPLEHQDASLLTYERDGADVRSLWSAVTQKLIADRGYAR